MEKVVRVIVVIMLSLVSQIAYAEDTEPSEPPLSIEDLGIFQIVSAYRYCSQTVRGFRSSNGSAYDRWRMENGDAIGRVEAIPWVVESLSSVDAKAAATTANDEPPKECAMLDEYLQDSITPADSRLSSPEATWRVWLQALRGGDRSAALRCLTGPARRDIGRLMKEMSTEEIKALGEFDDAVTMQGEPYGEFQDGMVSSRHGGGGIVVFLKTRRGEWKIQQL